MSDFWDNYSETERRTHEVMRRSSNEFYQMIGDVELTPAILEAKRNYVEDALEASRAEQHANYIARRDADVQRALDNLPKIIIAVC